MQLSATSIFRALEVQVLWKHYLIFLPPLVAKTPPHGQFPSLDEEEAKEGKSSPRPSQGNVLSRK